MSRAEELRKLADQLDAVGELEAELAEAKQAHRDEGSEESRVRLHDAKLAVREARAEVRESGPVAEPDAGGVTVAPAAVNGKAH